MGPPKTNMIVLYYIYNILLFLEEEEVYLSYVITCLKPNIYLVYYNRNIYIRHHEEVIIMIELQKLLCRKCGHEWLPRTPQPKKCPRCSSYKWEEVVEDENNG